MGHHPNLPEHRTAEDAVKAVPVFLEIYRGAPGVDLADGIQAAAVLADYGSSMFHSELSVASSLSEDQALAHLEDFAASQALKSRQPESFPWELIVPVVIEIILRLIRKRK